VELEGSVGAGQAVRGSVIDVAHELELELELSRELEVGVGVGHGPHEPHEPAATVESEHARTKIDAALLLRPIF
jgi:hypothetical protein